MERIVIDSDNIDSSLIKRITEVLLSGGIIALPTETVYGLAGCSDDERAIEKLYKVKGRPKHKEFTYALADKEKAKEYYFSTLAPFAYRLMDEYWPGPLTVIYYSPESKKVGIRIPSHPVALKVLERLGKPVFLSSANISGQKELLSASEIEATFKDNIDLIVDSPPGKSAKPSTILDLTYYPFKVIREGDVTKRDIVSTFIKKRILFVCTGNTCRSPMAQFLFKKYLEEAKPYLKDRYDIISRGISAVSGAKASSYIVDILREKENLDVGSFSAKRLTRNDILSSDLIFVMEASQRDYILKLEPTAMARIFHLGKFIDFESEEDIPDPISRGEEVYREVFGLIKKAVLELKGWM